MKRWPHAKPDKLGEASMAESKIYHVGWAKHKNSYLKAGHGG